ncbi:hypothetical protein [Kribbella sp. NPDC048928]|uniref:hypothetical protein n=1 Tax=Kribbella sp. NPDC048928 TaxID=3364111 RepID=UPI0037199288
MAVGAFLVVKDVPHGDRDLHAYESAARCPKAPSAPAECLWTEEFTVSDLHAIRSYQRGTSTAVLVSAGGARWETRYSGAGPVLDRIKDGDRVTGTIWRGRLMAIAADGASQETDQAPGDMRERSLGIALAIVPSGLLLLVGAVWRLVRRRGTAGMDAVVGLAGLLPLVAIVSALVVGVVTNLLWPSVQEIFWPFAAVYLLGGGFLAVAARRYAKNADDRRLPGIALR